jgi:LppP/LprE lipoprotein
MRGRFAFLFRHFRELLLCAVGVVSLLVVSPGAHGRSSGNSWLDQPLHNWNHPGANVPKAPAGGLDEPGICRDLIRKPSGPEDRAVMAAGWLLFGSLQKFSQTTVVLAESDADGMCRPLGYQAFVFVGGRFAGTVSPVPMNSRADGTMDPFELVRADWLNIVFSRYKESDPLCCPSAQTFVSYQIKTVNSWPLLVPRSLHTSNTTKD